MVRPLLDEADPAALRQNEDVSGVVSADSRRPR